MRYDLLVIGNTPAGHQAALAAASLGKKVAIVHAPRACGLELDLVGNPAFTFDQLRETLHDLPELLQGTGKSRGLAPQRIDLESVRNQFARLAEQDRKFAREQLRRNRVSTFAGEVSFQTPHQLSVTQNGGATHVVEAERILIASEMRPVRRSDVDFDGRRIFDPNDLLRLEKLPGSVHVIGAGETGLRCAVLLAELGTRVTVVDGRADSEDILTTEAHQRLWEEARALNVEFRLGEDVIHIARQGASRVSLTLESGRQLTAESALVATGNYAATQGLHLERAGLKSDERGRLWCNARQQTWTEHIYAAGDVVGFPAQAQSAAHSGVQAVRHAFDVAMPAIARTLVIVTRKVPARNPKEGALRTPSVAS